MRYYLIEYFSESGGKEWRIIIGNDRYRAKVMLGKNFISSTPWRDWRNQNNNMNDFDSWSTSSYENWKKLNLDLRQ